MLLPAELIDYILSFLRGDPAALRACLKTDPLLSRLAERYLYADIVVDSDAECYEHLSKNPHILYYPRTLEIHATKSTFIQDDMPIVAMIPRMANLISLKLCMTPGFYYFNPGFLSKLFKMYLHQSSIEQVHLYGFHNFPLSVLKNVKNIKKLTLSRCSSRTNTTSHQHLRIERLIILGSLDERLLSQITGQVLNLKSLQLPVVGPREWNAVSELVTAYSNSLTDLHLHFNKYFSGSVYSIDKARWTHTNIGLPPTFSPHTFLKHLKHLSILAPVESFPKPGPTMVYCALPAITNLLKTAPAIQEVFLRFHWIDSYRSSLAVGQLDWSLLEYDSPRIRPRIHLFISGDTQGRPIPSESILEILTQNETLMDLVKREVVILKVERLPPLEESRS